MTERARLGACVGAVVARRGPVVFIARPAAPGGRAGVFALVPSAGVARVLVHVGVTWTNRTTSAPWAARRGHTSMIDAAGAIYVIGGSGSFGTYYQDVWISTDGGAQPDSVNGVVGGYTKWVLRGS